MASHPHPDRLICSRMEQVSSVRCLTDPRTRIQSGFHSPIDSQMPKSIIIRKLSKLSDKYFFKIEKYESSAFKRTINHVATRSSSFYILSNICVRKSSKKGLFSQIRASTWLLASYTYDSKRLILLGSVKDT